MNEVFLKRNVVLQDYTPEWAAKYEIERDCWINLLKDNLIAIHHIGSTAIGRIKAKPIVDILVVVQSIEVLDAASDVLSNLGYEVKGENGISGRRYFQKDLNGERAYHIHAFKKDHHEIEDHLLFRNHMREFFVDALEYEALKIKLAALYKNDKPKYGLGKDSFIKEILKKAKARALVGAKYRA